MESLWPEDIVKDIKERTPYSILKEQGQLLGDKTNNVLRGIVKQYQDPFHFIYGFSIRSEILGYSYELFKTNHSITLYPLGLFFGDSEIASEINSPLKIEIKDESQFKDCLKLIFSSNKVKRIISVLISQSE